MQVKHTLTIIFSGLMLALGLVSGTQAEEVLQGNDGVTTPQQYHFLGQRPYAKAPAPKPEQAWEGAGLVTDQPEKRFDKHQQMRLHFIGKRPYIEPNKE